MAFRIGNANKMNMDSAGNVGIGIAAPTSRIHGVTTLSAATGDEIAYQLNYTTNKATSGNDTGLLINQTDTASPGTSFLIDAQVGGVSKHAIKNDGDVTGPKFRITPEGGYAILVVAGENLATGEVVYIKQTSGADGKVWKNPTDGDMPIGVCYLTASADASVWVVVAGIVGVLPTSGVTATRGYVMYSSGTEAGRVDNSTGAPVATVHFREVGHFLDTGAGNGLITRAIVHFN